MAVRGERDGGAPAPEPRLRTSRLELALLQEDDAEALLDFVERNRAHLEPWSPARDASYYTLAWWREHVAAVREDVVAGRSRPFVARLQGEPGPIVVRVNLSNVVRGAFQAAHLGYAIDAEHEGRGLAREAVEAVVRWAFDEWHLHRVMAKHMPENVRSGRLLEALGFEREGLARDYLRIAGAWRDHVLTSRSNPDWRPPGSS